MKFKLTIETEAGTKIENMQLGQEIEIDLIDKNTKVAKSVIISIKEK